MSHVIFETPYIKNVFIVYMIFKCNLEFLFYLANLLTGHEFSVAAS